MAAIIATSMDIVVKMLRAESGLYTKKKRTHIRFYIDTVGHTTLE